jgi:hypothetical protein
LAIRPFVGRLRDRHQPAGQAAVNDAMTIATRYGEDRADHRDQERVSFGIALN